MNTMIFQNKTAKKLLLTWRTEREINFLKYSWNESYFFWIKKKNVGWSERRCTVSLHELLVWFRHIGKEKERWLSEAQTTQHCQSIFILLLPRKKGSDLFTPWGWPKCTKLKMSAEKLALNLRFCAFWIYRARLSNVLIICRARKAIFLSQRVNSKFG